MKKIICFLFFVFSISAFAGMSFNCPKHGYCKDWDLERVNGSITCKKCFNEKQEQKKKEKQLEEKKRIESGNMTELDIVAGMTINSRSFDAQSFSNRCFQAIRESYIKVDNQIVERKHFTFVIFRKIKNNEYLIRNTGNLIKNIWKADLLSDNHFDGENIDIYGKFTNEIYEEIYDGGKIRRCPVFKEILFEELSLNDIKTHLINGNSFSINFNHKTAPYETMITSAYNGRVSDSLTRIGGGCRYKTVSNRIDRISITMNGGLFCKIDPKFK